MNDSSCTRALDDADAFARVHLRHNVLALGADFALFLVGLSFASYSTILPAFALSLGASNVIIGAIPAIITLGWFLPSVFAAGHTGTLRQRLPFVLRYTVWERVPFLVFAAVAFLLAERAPGVALVVLLAALLVMAGVGGVLMPAWMDVIGRAVPTTLRGRFFALTTALSSVGALAGSGVTTWILGAIRAPASYGTCFLIAALFMALSYAALAVVREPPAAVTPPTTLGRYLRRMPALLRRDTNFSWYLASRGLAIVGGMGVAFYTVYALRVLGAAPWRVGVFTALLYAGQVAGTLVLGWMADRIGHRAVVAVGVAATVAGNALALAAPDLAWFASAFLLAGVAQAAANVSSLNILLEFAPTAEERPTYVGLGNTAVGPIAFVAPVAGGLLADAAGFPAVFAVATAASIAATVVLVVRVREPRGAAA